MAIKLEKIKEEKKTNKLLFRMKGSDEVFANTIRRMILEEVPTLAVEDVEIKDNNSALYDEMLALRLGLVPIKTDLSSYSLPQSEEEVAERSAKCTLQLTLKASKKGFVKAGESQSKDPKCTFVQENMPVVKLLAKQKIDVTMYAVMGQGKNHAKWSPGWPIYKHEQTIKVGSVKDTKLVMDNCTDGVFTLKGDKLQVNEDKAVTSHLLDYYAELDKGITVENTGNIIFSLESWGQLTHKEILTTSAEMLIAKAEDMEKLL